MLDTLGRRLRFAPPQPREGFIQITDRDMRVFEAINRHGPLPVHYLHHYAGGYLPQLKKKISKLVHGTTIQDPYLCRPEAQWASVDGKFQPNIYDLTDASRIALVERGIRLVNRTDPFVHRFMGACVNAAIEIAAARQGYKYADFSQLLTHPKCPEATKNLPNPLAFPVTSKHVLPDAVFGIQKDRPSFYAVEIDRRTESINSDTAKTAYGRKLEGYLHIFANKTYRTHLGIPNLKVLTITTNVVHLRKMIDFYYTLNAPGYAGNFLFKSIQGFGPSWHVPQVMYDLFNEPWIAADGKTQTIG